MEGMHESDGFVPTTVSREQVERDRKRAEEEAEELGQKFWRRFK